MGLLFAGILLFLALLSASFVWNFKKNQFMEQESKRVFNDLCKVNNDWNSQGRVYTNGFTVTEENGNMNFIKQSKLCDGGILS